MIIVDEMQKFANGTLEVFNSGLGAGNFIAANPASSSFFFTTTETHRSISTENTIFLFITDVGADKLEELVVSYGNRDRIPQSVIRKTARSALVHHTGNVNFAKLISEVIPYMPMERSQIQDLLRMKIRKLPYILNVDDSAVEYMSGPSFVDYVSASTSSPDEMVSGYKSFSNLGGRAITNGEREVIKIAVF